MGLARVQHAKEEELLRGARQLGLVLPPFDQLAQCGHQLRPVRIDREGTIADNVEDPIAALHSARAVALHVGERLRNDERLGARW